MLTTVRDGKKAPPTCPDCGCRLNVVTIEDIAIAHHFAHDFDSGKDARDHTCSSLGRVWSLKGKQNARN